MTYPSGQRSVGDRWGQSPQSCGRHCAQASRNAPRVPRPSRCPWASGSRGLHTLALAPGAVGGGSGLWGLWPSASVADQAGRGDSAGPGRGPPLAPAAGRGLETEVLETRAEPRGWGRSRRRGKGPQGVLSAPALNVGKLRLREGRTWPRPTRYVSLEKGLRLPFGSPSSGLHPPSPSALSSVPTSTEGQGPKGQATD